MQMFRRLFILAVLSAFAMALASPAFAAPLVLATAETEEEGGTVEAPVVEYDGPAAYIESEEVAADEDIPQWTYQYMIPATIVLVMLMTVALAVGYFVRVVGKRYTVVE